MKYDVGWYADCDGYVRQLLFRRVHFGQGPLPVESQLQADAPGVILASKIHQCRSSLQAALGFEVCLITWH